MELTIYDIIKGPVISDKAYKLNKQFNQLFLYVNKFATKHQIKDALEKLFNIKVEDVRTSNRIFKKSRGVGKRKNNNPSEVITKVAYITLAEGYSLNLFEQTTGSQAVNDESKKTASAA